MTEHRPGQVVRRFISRIGAETSIPCGLAVQVPVTRPVAGRNARAVGTDPPHVWHQKVVDPGDAVGYDGVVNGYFPRFGSPRSSPEGR